jgi:excisionase family DNA binding protein
VGAVVPSLEEIRAMVREELARALAEVRPPAAGEGWATTEQAAELLGVTPKTVGRWAAAGRLRATRHGRTWRIDRAGLPAPKPASPEEHARVAVLALHRGG